MLGLPLPPLPRPVRHTGESMSRTPIRGRYPGGWGEAASALSLSSYPLSLRERVGVRVTPPPGRGLRACPVLDTG